jgi:mgtE-like transporter
VTAARVVRALRPDVALRRFVELLGPTGGAARQSLAALTTNSLTSLVAGLLLIGFKQTWAQHPPLLLLIPAAVGLRGNIFSTLGSRISTSIHMGTFHFSSSRDSVLGQNLIASAALTLTMSTLLAAFAKVLAIGLGVPHHMPLGELVTISVVGGLLASLVIATATVALTRGSVQRGWDLDNLVAPSISTLGDVVTIPAIWLAVTLFANRELSNGLGIALLVISIVVAVVAWGTRHQELRTIVRESTPILTAALVLSGFAGLVLQKQTDLLVTLSALLAMQPALVSSTGALGGIMCGRVATNLHLGNTEPTLAPNTSTMRDVWLIFALALPIIVLNGVGGFVVAVMVGGDAQPNVWWCLLVSLIAMLTTTTFVMALAYYTTVMAWRVNLDPDSFGIPVVTAAVDFIGTVILVVTAIMLGLAT